MLNGSFEFSEISNFAQAGRFLPPKIFFDQPAFSCLFVVEHDGFPVLLIDTGYSLLSVSMILVKTI